jgi:hypothetical protein
MLAPQSEIQNPINRPAGFREGEPPGEPLALPARTEPRPPKITKSHLSKIDRGGESEPENLTSEANGDENVVTIQNEEPVAVAANAGVDSALDKPDKPPCGANGGASAELPTTPPGAPEIPRPDDAGGGDHDLIAARQSAPPDGDTAAGLQSSTDSANTAAPNGEIDAREPTGARPP